MTEKIIRIENILFEDAKKAIQQWIDLYADDLPSNFQITIHSNDKTHYLDVDKRIDNERFYYLVNYLNYPENKFYNAKVEGLIVGQEKQLKNNELLIYIPKNNTEYDNVFAVSNKNQHFKIDFGGRISEIFDNKKFSTFELDKTHNPCILRASKRNINKKTESTEDTKIASRFKVVLLIVLFASAINFILPFITNDQEIFEKSTWILFMGIGLWFFIDYEMLRHEQLYLRCLIISLGVVAYAYFLSNYFQTNISDITFASSLYPFVFLLIQWPIRRIYKAVFKREPKVDKHGKFADLIYSLILFIGLVIIPYLIVDYVQ